jgi:hypothetical protein
MERPANEVWQPVHVPPQAKGVARTGGLGTDTAEVSQHPGLPGQIGLESGLSGWQLRAEQKATVLNVKDAEPREPRFVDV